MTHGIPPPGGYRAVVFDADDPGPEYALRWPGELFREEATALVAAPHPAALDFTRAAQLLLREAFADETPSLDLGAAAWSEPYGETSARQFLRGLRDATQRLPTPAPPRPYWSVRRGTGTAPGPSGGTVRLSGPDQLRRDWANLVGELQVAGYLEKAAPTPCVDDRGDPPQPALVLERLTAERTGRRELWPLDPGAWDEDTFYDLVELVHDLVARPRDRWTHDFGDCGFHYGSFTVRTGQAVYRWRVNELFGRHGAHVRLADDGEDAGRLVHVAGDERDLLVERTLATPEPRDRDATRHAIALFRGRAATREEKRSATAALARVLEDRRALLKSEMLSKDEGALFQIANEFDIRHRGVRGAHGKVQREDYADAFLDWVFWWYLSTVELTDRLLADQSRTP